MERNVTGISGLMGLAADQHGCFSRVDAHACLVSAKQLRHLRDAGHIIEFGASTFLVHGRFDPLRQRAMAATLAFTGSAVSGRTAAALHGLGDVCLSESPIDLWLPPTARNQKEVPMVRPLRNNAVDAGLDILEIDGIACTSAAVTLVQLGDLVSRDELRHALDDFERRFSKSWLEDTVSRMHGPGRRGVRQLREVLQDPRRVDGVTESWMERILADLASRPGLPQIMLQCPVTVNKSTTYRIDAAFPALRLGIEGHSREHHFGPQK